MAVRSIALIPSKIAENVQTTQYVASNVTTYIDKFTVTNNTSANVTFSVNIVTFTDTPGADNLILPLRTIAPRETYTCPELVGQVLEQGDFISTIAGAGASLTMRASGREIT